MALLVLQLVKSTSTVRARNVIKDLSKLSIYHYHINGVFTPRSLKKNVFTVIAKDNIDKNARSNTASSHYQGISRTVMQLPKVDISGDNLAIHPINKEDGYDLTSMPSSYSIVVQVFHCKESSSSSFHYSWNCRWISKGF